MGVQRAVFVVILSFAALASIAVGMDEDYILTAKMLSNDNPTSGKVIAPDTPSGKKNVGYQAFDRKRYNKVPMYCADAGCQPLQLKYHFTEVFSRCKNYKLYVASDIPVEQKPVNWTLECQNGTQDPWHTLDTVVDFDWSSTEVYAADLEGGGPTPLCSKYMLTMSNPLDAEGGMTATISELLLYGALG